MNDHDTTTKRQPTIIFVNRFFYPDQSATALLLSDLAFHLSAKGWHITVVTSRHGYDRRTPSLPLREVIGGIHIYRVWSTNFGRSRQLGQMLDYVSVYAAMVTTLLWVSRRNDVVVVKTDPPMIGFAAGAATILRGGQVVNWLQDLFPEIAIALRVKGMGGFLGNLLQTARRWSIAWASANVVLGSKMEAFLAWEGIAAERITLIHNWADTKDITPIAPEDNPLRESWGLRDKFVVGYSGNMGRVHEFNTLLDAAELLRDDQDIVFLFIGEGYQQPMVKREVKRRGLARVIFKPYQPREALRLSLGVPDVHFISMLPQVEGCAVPSKFYGIAAAGRPTLFVGDQGGELARVIKSSGCGCVVTIGDATELAHRILFYRDHPATRQAAGVVARILATGRFNKEAALTVWEGLLVRVLETAEARVHEPSQVIIPESASVPIKG
ncbi:colanic acid biosynthesis glycosyl transferase WcaI [Gammaproteobacteria bacterium]